VDEVQNMTFEEADTIQTRIGLDTKVIFSGDYKQGDLKKKNDVSGFQNFRKIIAAMDEFDIVTFHPKDIVRSGLVKSYLMTKERLGL